MSGTTFQEHYEQLTNDELAQVLAGKEDLVPEALKALNREVEKRNFVMPESPQWSRRPGSEERAKSLEDYEEYRTLLERKRTFGRYWYLVAMGPFVLGLLLGKTLFENSIVFIFITLAWAMCVAIYGLILNAHFLGFKCPQCSQSFGRGGECFNCGFPRSATK